MSRVKWDEVDRDDYLGHTHCTHSRYWLRQHGVACGRSHCWMLTVWWVDQRAEWEITWWAVIFVGGEDSILIWYKEVMPFWSFWVLDFVSFQKLRDLSNKGTKPSDVVPKPLRTQSPENPGPQSLEPSRVENLGPREPRDLRAYRPVPRALAAQVYLCCIKKLSRLRRPKSRSGPSLDNQKPRALSPEPRELLSGRYIVSSLYVLCVCKVRYTVELAWVAILNFYIEKSQ